MGTVVHLKTKKKEPPRGPRGGRVLKKGQTIVSTHDRVKYVIRRVYEHEDRKRVVISEKGRRNAPERDLAESAIKCKAQFMLEEDYIKFENELRQNYPEFFDASDGIAEVEPPQRQPLPKKGELWKGNSAGKYGPRIYLIKDVSRSPFGGLVLSFLIRGGWGVQPADSFREEKTRIGWLGE